MITIWRIRCLAAIVGCATALGFAGLAAATPAVAAPAARYVAPASLHSTVSAVTVRSYRNASGDPCQTYDGEDTLYSGPSALAFVLFTTNFCYNGVTVTSHANFYNPGVTSAGSDAGWVYVAGSQNYEWHCYVANGSTRNCSGNEEDVREQFDKCSAFRGCSSYWFPNVDQEQNYKGQHFIEES